MSVYRQSHLKKLVWVTKKTCRSQQKVWRRAWRPVQTVAINEIRVPTVLDNIWKSEQFQPGKIPLLELTTSCRRAARQVKRRWYSKVNTILVEDLQKSASPWPRLSLPLSSQCCIAYKISYQWRVVRCLIALRGERRCFAPGWRDVGRSSALTIDRRIWSKSHWHCSNRVEGCKLPVLSSVGMDAPVRVCPLFWEWQWRYMHTDMRA